MESSVIKAAMAQPKSTTPQPSDAEIEFTAAVEAGIQSLDKGRALSYEGVRRWLLSWGTDKELPPPECP
jgi:predicted transcriptional regulator